MLPRPNSPYLEPGIAAQMVAAGVNLGVAAGSPISAAYVRESSRDDSSSRRSVSSTIRNTNWSSTSLLPSVNRQDAENEVMVPPKVFTPSPTPSILSEVVTDFGTWESCIGNGPLDFYKIKTNTAQNRGYDY